MRVIEKVIENWNIKYNDHLVISAIWKGDPNIIADNTPEEKKAIKTRNNVLYKHIIKIIVKIPDIGTKKEIDIAFIASLSVDDKIIYLENLEEPIGKNC